MHYQCLICKENISELKSINDETYRMHKCESLQEIWNKLSTQERKALFDRARKNAAEQEADSKCLQQFSKVFDPNSQDGITKKNVAAAKELIRFFLVEVKQPEAETFHKNDILYTRPKYDSTMFNEAADALEAEFFTYGARPCQRCGDGKGHAISESTITRLVANWIYDYITNIRKAKVDPGFVLGVAHRQGDNVLYVATSTTRAKLVNILDDIFFIEVEGYEFCIDDGQPVELNKTRCGYEIPRDLKHLAEVKLGGEGDRDSGTCAASKIAIKFIKSTPLKEWNMTELAVGAFPQSQRLRDGEAAPSCVGCQKFLPCLLCDDSQPKRAKAT